MRTALYISAALLGFLLLTAQSCAEADDEIDSSEVTAEKWEQIKPGMTKDATRSILGDPDYVETSDVDEQLRYSEVWTWGGTPGYADYEVSFDRGRVAKKRKCSGGRRAIACRITEGGD